MNETAFKTKVLKVLQSKGGWWYKSADKFTAGIPDILGVYNGKFIAIELKVKPNKPTPLQLHTLHLININNGSATVLYPEDDLNGWLEEVLR